MHRTIRIIVSALCLSLLGACATYAPPPSKGAPVYSGGGPQGPSYNNNGVAYGQVRSIEPIGMSKDQPQGAGAVVGGLVGAIVGRQFADSAHGQNTGMVVGAVGGALIGNEIEKNARRESTGWRITIALDQGGVRSFDYREAGGLRVGDRVRVEGNQIVRL